MRVPTASSVFVLLGVLLSTGWGQSLPPGAPIPPGYGSAPPTIYTPAPSRRSPAPQIDTAAVQREAKELLELSQSVQPDIESLKRGLLSNDLTDKLKRIEKLSKRLRNEITPLGN
jgi:hypothetical protein